MSALQIYLLGSLEIRSNNELLAKPATAKSQSLLEYLAWHRDTSQYREQLANLLWEDWPTNKARRSLSTALWRIRSRLRSSIPTLRSPASPRPRPATAGRRVRRPTNYFR